MEMKDLTLALTPSVVMLGSTAAKFNLGIVESAKLYDISGFWIPGLCSF